MSIDHLKYLLDQYAANASTPHETKELFEWIKKSKDDLLLKLKIKELWSAHENGKQLPNVDWNAIYTRIIETPVIEKRQIWYRVAAAAVVIILLSVGGYVTFKKHDLKQTLATKEKVQPKNNPV